MSGTIQPGNPWNFLDRSGTIASGGVAQVLAPVNSQRRGMWVQNVSSGDLWVNATGTATAGSGSIRIPPNALYECPVIGAPCGEVSIFGATTGQAFTAREFF